MAKLTEQDLSAWRDRSLILWKAATLHGYGYPPAKAGGFNTTFTMFSRSCPELAREWEGPTREAFTRRYLEPSTLGNARLATQYRILRLGHAMAFGSRGHLSGAEVGFLRSMGMVDHEAVAAEGTAKEVDRGLAVDFAFRYPGRSAGTRRSVYLASRATVFVERVDACETVPYATLRTRLGLEVPFARLGDGWIRPLVAPGGKGFLDEDAFAWACAGVEPWADDPFTVPPQPGRERGSPLAVLEAARLEGPDASLNAKGAQAMSRACLKWAGRLVSVDGVVHVGCPEPVLAPMTSVDRSAVLGPYEYHPRTDLSVGWASGRIDSETDFGLIPDHMAPEPQWPDQSTRRWPTFALGHAAMARDVAKGYAKVVGLAYRHVDHGTTASDVDPVGALDRALSSMTQVLGASEASPRRDVILKALRSNDRKGLKQASNAIFGDGERILPTIARVSLSALDGEYDTAVDLDDEADMAAMAP